MKETILIEKPLPQNPKIKVFVPNYKEPILPVVGGFGYLGLQAYNEEGLLMCHKCGKFYDKLAGHIHTHNLSIREYRQTFGLLLRSPLCSKKYSEQQRIKTRDHPEIMKQAKQNLIKGRQNRSKAVPKNALEYQNRKDSCSLQLLRRLKEASIIYGEGITSRQANIYYSGFERLLAGRFGSFNKAKQIVKLRENEAHVTLSQARPIGSILEDMCIFYVQNGYWPTKKDYSDSKRLGMLCSYSTAQRIGLVFLRQEAHKLLEEQRQRAKKTERISQIAGEIELQFAGRGRR